MIVCQCESVRDAQVRMAVSVGAISVGAIKAATAAGTDCGTCTLTLCEILKEQRPDLTAARIDACAECEHPECQGHAHHEHLQPLYGLDRDVT